MRQYVMEDEAHGMWCPMVRDTELDSGNSDWSITEPENRNPRFARCIGSFCMFWCWKDEYGAGMGVVASKTHGYCGATR